MEGSAATHPFPERFEGHLHFIYLCDAETYHKTPLPPALQRAQNNGNLSCNTKLFSCAAEGAGGLVLVGTKGGTHSR